MVRVQIQLPLNISRSLEEVLREHIEINQEEYGRDIIIENLHSCGEKNRTDLKPADIMIGFMPELLTQSDDYIAEYFRGDVGRFPINEELQEQSFYDERGFFHIFGIVPFIMFYNTDCIDVTEVPHTWSELLNPRWKGRVIMPGKEHMAPKVIRAVFKYENSNKAQAVDENITCRGMPLMS